MFTDEELIFIGTLLEDELFKIRIKQCKIEDYNEVKKYKEIMKPRVEFIESILDKLKDY